MTEELETIQGSTSILEMTQNINGLVGEGLGIGLVLVVFSVSFFRLSPGGYLAAFTASSFTSSILSFILASASLLPVEMPFLFAAMSVGSLAYMYMNQRI